MTTVRPDVVALFADLDCTDTNLINAAMRGEPVTLLRQTGVPYTVPEVELMRTGTKSEFKAAIVYSDAAVDFQQAKADDLGRITELLGPHFAGLPETATTAVVMPLLTDAERAEVEEILDRIAPDGHVYIEGS